MHSISSFVCRVALLAAGLALDLYGAQSSMTLMGVGGPSGSAAAVTWTTPQSVFTGPGNCYLNSPTPTSGCSSRCTNAAASCTTALYQATTAHTALAIYIITVGNTATIGSAYTCTSSSGCTSGNAVDTFTLTSGANHITNGSSGSNDNLDGAYVANGAGGATYLTVNVSGDSGGTYLSVGLIEFQRSTGTPTYDASATTDSASCTSCTLAALTLSGSNDAIAQLDDTDNSFTSNPSSPYQYSLGNSTCSSTSAGACYVAALGATNGNAPTITQGSGGFMSITALAFK